MMLKKTFVSLLFILSVFSLLRAQEIGVKTNSLHWATLSPNLGIEIALSKKITLDISGGFNPFKLSGEKYLNHWIVQPEARYWLCEPFNGHFFGVHLLGGQFNIGNVNIPIGRLKTFKDARYEGNAWGGGFTYGHQWMFASRWGIEAAIGAGYVYLDYNKFPCGNCGTKLATDVKHYLGVTKAAISVIYFIK